MRLSVAVPLQEMLGIPLLGAIPEDQQVIISTNRGEPLVLQKKLSLSGIAFENAARRLIGKQDYFVDVQVSGVWVGWGGVVGGCGYVPVGAWGARRATHTHGRQQGAMGAERFAARLAGRLAGTF